MRDAVLFTLAVLSRERLPMRVRHNGLRTGIRQFFPLTQNADCYLDAAAISMTRTRQNAKVTPPEKDRSHRMLRRPASCDHLKAVSQ